jgi:hypothetical protein
MLEKAMTLVRSSQCSYCDTTVLGALLVCIAILLVFYDMSWRMQSSYKVYFTRRW